MLDKLKSRKLWVAVLSAAVFILNGDVNQALAVLVAYIVAQGYADAGK